MRDRPSADCNAQRQLWTRRVSERNGEAFVMSDVRRVPAAFVAIASVSILCPLAGATQEGRPVRHYLQIAAAPSGALVASVEGDAPLSGSEPQLQELKIRRTDSGAEVNVSLPCGHVPECWPGSPAWTPDGKQLAFTVRAPGTHARSIYTVAPDGSRLTKVLSFDGTLIDLRYGPGGRLAVLATEHATK